MKKLLLSFALVLICLYTFAQASITTTIPVSQNFDGIGATATASLPTNWKVDKLTSARTLGTFTTAVSATERIDGENIATNASNGIYNYGIAPEGTATDRSIGFLSSTSDTKSGNLYIQLRNTGSTIKSFIISYDIEKYRNGSNASGFSFQLYYSLDGTTWTSAGSNFLTTIAADANNNGTATPPLSSTSVSSFINLPADLVTNSDFYLAWNYSVASGTTTSNSQALGIDNITIQASSTLPITLTSFTGKEANKSIVLNWITASEKNNKNFEILRSVDGKNFKSIGTVNGAGDSNAELKYSFVDANPFGGTNYYQLKQIDFDGKNSTSSTIAVDSKIAETQITVYAASSSLNIGITSPNETSGKITLFDISGRKITEQNISLNKGYNTLELNETLTPGVHFVTLENEGRVYRQKFIK